MVVKVKAANSGTDAQMGFEFQRNCALYLLLSDYGSFKNREFFLYIEHHDDFLFCYREPTTFEVQEVEAYQAKKLSGKLWTVDNRFAEIIAKMLEVGTNLHLDPIRKSPIYEHKLIFISNTESDFRYKPKKADIESGKKEVYEKINEQNCVCKYDSMPGDVRKSIEAKVKSYCEDKNTTYHNQELCNIYIQYVELERSAKAQKERLLGLMVANFPHVVDPKAAVDLLLSLFRKVELVYNQNHIVSLDDLTKRVEGGDVKKAIGTIENRQKMYHFWRDNANSFIESFNIPIGIQKKSEQFILRTFELSKDMENNEHQIIKRFVERNDYSMDYSKYENMFKAYISDIKSSNQIQLTDIHVFFAVLCAYVEYYGEMV
ncbi:dsDNA nuclease domain-containing protein [Vibrio lentus]|uniref:dsDNA nuclease domain-containing protein n=1 Tax=Vibrio lentus TaxID=136468 RepID=UPI00097583AE|nr:dsDNA nuclease domain-containing protein [Vibrio lentus]OMO23163.1 hypothetical protein BH583_07545 [Vibrio lentus]